MKSYFTIPVLLCLVLIGVCGCEFFSGVLDQGPCQSKACDRDSWVVLGSSGLDFTMISVWDNRIRDKYLIPDGYFIQGEYLIQEGKFDFVTELLEGEFYGDHDWDDHVVSLSVNRGGDLRVASATRDGYLNVSRFGRPSAEFREPLGAIGVRWSNAGDRLAVVRRTADATLVTIYDGPDLANEGDLTNEVAPSPLAEHAIDFPRPDERSDYWRAVVSWRDDDSWILVSTDATSIDTSYTDIRNDVLRPVTFLIDPAAGELATFPFSNAHFLQGNQVVANGRFQGNTTAPHQASQMLRVGRVSPTGLTIERSIDAQMAIDSDPLSGAMVTVEIWRPGLLPVLPPPYTAIALRTLGSAPVDIGTGPLSHYIYQLIPLEALTE